MPFCTDLYYRIYEEGKNNHACPVILLHGAAGSHSAWPGEIRRIPGWQVIALDLPGHGKSTGAACRSLNGLVNRLYRFIREMGLHQVIMVGYSLGGALALDFSSKHPKFVKGLVILACGSSFYLPSDLLDAFRNPAKRNQAIEIFNRLAFDAGTAQPLRRTILNPLAKVRTGNIMSDLSIGAHFKVKGDYQNIECPVGLIGGKSDQIATLLAVRQLFHFLPKASLQILPGCGHMLIYEKTHMICQNVGEILNTIDTP
jgi:pimeloyl-ACP methyl ester carboxylesterase